MRKRKENVGEVMRKFRKSIKMTQEKLADSVGVSPKYIQYIETARRNPSLKTLYKIAKALKVRVKDLFS